MTQQPTSAVVQEKLPHEQEHLTALWRMCRLNAYYQWTYDLLAPWIGTRVLDAGCGIGNFTEIVRHHAEFVMAIDLSPENIQVLRERFADVDNVEIQQIDLDTASEQIAAHQIDTAVCLDVIEHIAEPVPLLQSLRRIVQPGGRLLIKVPALQWLFGSIDEASGHYRRYTRKTLREHVEAAGWHIEKMHYMNIVGVLPYWIKSRVLRKQANFSRTFSDRQIAGLRRAIPAARFVDQIMGPVIGQSLVLAARRQER